MRAYETRMYRPAKRCVLGQQTSRVPRAPRRLVRVPTRTIAVADRMRDRPRLTFPPIPSTGRDRAPN